MKKALAFTLLALLIPTSAVLASHAWSVYHWSTGDLNPTVKDRTSDPLYDVTAGLNEWSALGTPIQPTVADRKGDITVREASSIFWLGLARIFIDEDGHITKGEVLLNTRLLKDYGAAAADHVLCQEVGHILGLDHSDDLDSCMNDQAVLGSVTAPNNHDATTLLAIYDHADVVPDDNGGGGPPCSKNPNHPNCRPAGRWVTVDIFPVP